MAKKILVSHGLAYQNGKIITADENVETRNLLPPFFAIIKKNNIRLINSCTFSDSSLYSESNDMQQAYVLYNGKVDIVDFWLDDVIIYKTGQETFLCFWICANFFLVVVLTLMDQKNIVA